jgi:hypothetical protein
MTRYASGLLLGLGLVLAAGLTMTVRADDDDEKEIKEAQKDILDLTKTVEGGKKNDKAVEAKVAAIKKKYGDLEPLMHIYKPKNRGGLGFGPKATNGIDLKIRELGKFALNPATLQKESRELTRMVYLNLAMTEITRHYFPGNRNGKNEKDWKQYLADVMKSSRDLLDAIKARNPVRLKDAATRLETACNGCHTDFR